MKHEKAKPDFSVVKCWDPSTLTYLGEVRADTKDSVELKIKKCGAAQEVWAKSTFAQRRQLMKTMLRFVVENQATIAKVAVRDSGKTVTDAIFGEVLVTCEQAEMARGERRSTCYEMRSGPPEVLCGSRRTSGSNIEPLVSSARSCPGTIRSTTSSIPCRPL